MAHTIFTVNRQLGNNDHHKIILNFNEEIHVFFLLFETYLSYFVKQDLFAQFRFIALNLMETIDHYGLNFTKSKKYMPQKMCLLLLELAKQCDKCYY